MEVVVVLLVVVVVVVVVVVAVAAAASIELLEPRSRQQAVGSSRFWIAVSK